MINIGKEINTILSNKYIKIGSILLLLIFVVSFDSKFNKYFSIRLEENIVYRLLLILIIILLFVNKHYELSIMLILIFIISLYNSRLRSLLKIKINNAVNKLDEKIENFIIKDNIFNINLKKRNNKLKDLENKDELNNLSHNDIIYSEKPFGQISEDIGLDSYSPLNNETQKDLS